jgi:hypothetical protein
MQNPYLFCLSLHYDEADLYFVSQASYENMYYHDPVTQFLCSSGVISDGIQLSSLNTKQVALWQTTCSQ